MNTPKINGATYSVPRKFINRVIDAWAKHPIKTGLLTLAIDQSSKLAISNYYHVGEKSCVSSWLCIQPAINRGSTFGTPLEFGTAAKILTAAALVSLAGVFVKASSQVTKLSLALIVSGWVGNLFDRLTSSGVKDYIKIGSWYNFNFADAAIVTGGLLLLHEIFRKPSSTNSEFFFNNPPYC